MSQINQFKILNLDNNKQLIFHSAVSHGQAITINNVSFNLPGQDSDQNYVANFGGFKRLINVSFRLFNDGTDKSGSGGVVTLSEQVDHLMDTGGVIQGANTSQTEVLYRVTVFRDGASKTYTGGIENINIDFDENNGNVANGTLTIVEGGN